MGRFEIFYAGAIVVTLIAVAGYYGWRQWQTLQRGNVGIGQRVRVGVGI
jgi:hypothetical protein